MTLVWTPQQAVDVALVVSALGLVLCLVLAFVPLRRTRRRRMAADGTIDDGDESDVGATVPTEGDPAPGWWLHGPRTASRPGGVRAVATGVVCGLVAAFISAPLIGGLVGIGIVVVLRVPRLRLLLGAVATLLILGTGTFIIIRQGVDATQANGGWPSEFGGANGLAWAGVLFLGADAVLEIRDRLRGSVPDEPRSAGAPESARGTPSRRQRILGVRR